MILDHISNFKTYAAFGKRLARGLALLHSGKLDKLPCGKHLLDGERLFASVQEYEPKEQSEGRWEAHRKYIDIQYMVRGCEIMGVAAVGRLKVKDKYNGKNDVAFMKGKLELGTGIKVKEKMFAIFFPGDAHMPCLRAADFYEDAADKLERGYRPVKKIVVKVLIG